MYKENRARNKRLITKFPWLRGVDWLGNPIDDKRYTYISLWHDIPKGWILAFGEQMCEEIEAALEEDGLERIAYIQQAKEKYGQLRIYMYGYNAKTDHIISIYSAISEHVCCECGKPHVPMLNISWISPFCKDCYGKYINCTRTYEEITPEDKMKWKIPNELKWTRYQNDEEQTETVDITERVAKIERRWNTKHPDDKV